MFHLRSRASAPSVYLVIRAVWGFAFGLIVTVYALLYIQVAGLGPLQLVLVGTILEASYFAFEIPTGALADTYSRRFSIIAGFAIIAFAWLGQALVPAFLAILLLEAIRGVGEAFLSGAQDAWIAGEVGDDAVGPLFLRGHQIGEAAWVLSIPVSVASGLVDVRLPVVIGGALFAGLAVYLLVAMPERGFTRVPTTDRSWTKLAKTAREGTRVVRGRPILISLAAIAFFGGLASEGTDRLYEAHFLTDLGLPVGLPPVVWFGLIGIGGSLISIVVVQVLRRRLDDLVTDDRAMANIIAGCTAARIACQLAFAWAPGFAIGLAATWGQSLLAIDPLAKAWTIRQIDPSVRATVLSMNGTLNAFGQIAGGPPVGAIGATLGIRAALTASAALLVPTVFLLASAAKRRAPGRVRL